MTAGVDPGPPTDVDGGPSLATSRDLVAAGLTYRQVDYWCHRGWLDPEPGAASRGTVRQFSDAEVRVAVAMARLVSAGLQPEAAARVARAAAGRFELAPGVTVTVADLP